MDEVSAKTLGVVIDGLATRGIPIERWLSGSGVTAERALSWRGRLDWDEFAGLVARLDTLLGGPEELERLGYEHIDTQSLGVLPRVAGAIADPRDIFVWGTRWFGGSLFGIVDARVEVAPDGRVIETLRIPEPYQAIPGLFYIIKGALRSGPMMLGLPPAHVTAEINERTATYAIEMPGRPGGWGHRLKRLMAVPRALRSAMQELSTQQQFIEQGHHDLRNARERIEAQAERLAVINRIGAELTQSIELSALARSLAQALDEHVAPVGVSLTVTDHDGESLPLLGEGGREGLPTRSYRLGIAGQDLGVLELWLDDGSRNRRLLDDLAPWIAIALDNARSYAAISEHNSLLAARVSERTAELIKTNEKLQEQVEERNLADLALAESAEQLRAAERLAAVGTLAAGIAHEINNPIASILAASEYASVCRDDEDSREVAQNALEDIATNAMRCAEIVRGVMQFAQQGGTTRSPGNLRKAVDTAAAAARAYGGARGVEVRVEHTEVSIQCRLQSFSIEQALLHVLRNAIEASSPGQCVHARVSLSGAWARIVVIDRGHGIAPSDRPQIFDPFFTTRRNLGNYGLGLAVAHGVITQHGGRITVDSHPNRGTEFQIELPLSDTGSAEAPLNA